MTSVNRNPLDLNPTKTRPETRKQILQEIANELASKNERWKFLFSFAQTRGTEAWIVVSFIYEFESGTSLSQNSFALARAAKLLATTEKWGVDERLVTKKDLVNWNRLAILAMIEAEKQGESNEEKIERGYKAIELINALFPEFLISDKKSFPFPRW